MKDHLLGYHQNVLMQTLQNCGKALMRYVIEKSGSSAEGEDMSDRQCCGTMLICTFT